MDSVKQSFFYTHDVLGRMTSDGLSGTRMEYNHMNLLSKVLRGDSTLVNYTYLADGTKLSSLKDSGEGLIYRGPFTYRRLADGVEVLESVVCDEGRLTPDRALIYVTDHLGSVRAVIDGETGNSLEKSDYSVYGQRTGRLTAGGFTCRDHFTGKEDQMPDFGIPYSDHGARQYSPSLCRWMTPDPLSEKYYGLSPYAYCASNPVNAVDPDGRDWYEIESNGEKLYKYTECKSQTEMDIAGISGKYLGEVVVVFLGNNNEKLGANNKMDGEGSISAKATIYGKNGQDNIMDYTAMTTPYDRNMFNTLNEGEYSAHYQDMPTSIYGERGAKGKTIPALTYIIDSPIGTSPKGETVQMIGVYFHRSNWDGGAQRTSEGCLIVDGRQWHSVENQIGHSSKIHIILTRE